MKEQSSGLYAQKMAEYGYLTIAFDPSYTGESGGQPRSFLFSGAFLLPLLCDPTRFLLVT